MRPTQQAPCAFPNETQLQCRMLRLLEKLRANIPRPVNDGSDENPVLVFAVKHDMGLKAKPPIPRPKCGGILADAGEVGQQAENAFEARDVSFSLIGAEPGLAVGVDGEKFESGAFGKAEFSQCDGRRAVRVLR